MKLSVLIEAHKDCLTSTNKCITHSASQRNTIRKGKGESQSSYDNQGSGKTNSVGAQNVN